MVLFQFLRKPVSCLGQRCFGCSLPCFVGRKKQIVVLQAHVNWFCSCHNCQSHKISFQCATGSHQPGAKKSMHCRITAICDNCNRWLPHWEMHFQFSHNCCLSHHLNIKRLAMCTSLVKENENAPAWSKTIVSHKTIVLHQPGAKSKKWRGLRKCHQIFRTPQPQCHVQKKQKPDLRSGSHPTLERKLTGKTRRARSTGNGKFPVLC